MGPVRLKISILDDMILAIQSSIWVENKTNNNCKQAHPKIS